MDASPLAAQPSVRAGIGDHGGPLFGVGYDEDVDSASGPLRSTVVPGPPAVAQRWMPAPVGAVADKPSKRAVASMIIGLLSMLMLCGFVFTIPVDLVGVALAFLELRAIAQGERPAAGRSLAVIGLVLCSIVLAVKAFIALAFLG
ncbi:MAG: hypothetical protein IT175_02580 [Acidobacteria bacterium]|nr:hypothetical protein [Acidobacteriota bacterium]